MPTADGQLPQSEAAATRDYYRRMSCGSCQRRRPTHRCVECCAAVCGDCMGSNSERCADCEWLLPDDQEGSHEPSSHDEEENDTVGPRSQPGSQQVQSHCHVCEAPAPILRPCKHCQAPMCSDPQCASPPDSEVCAHHGPCWCCNSRPAFHECFQCTLYFCPECAADSTRVLEERQQRTQGRWGMSAVCETCRQTLGAH